MMARGMRSRQRMFAVFLAMCAGSRAPPSRLRTMVNMVATQTRDVITMVKEKFGDRVYETTIPRNVRTSEAPSYGQPVMHYDPTCKGAVAYRAFAKEFIARTPTRFDETPSAPPTAEPSAEPATEAAAEAPAAPTDPSTPQSDTEP